MKSLNKIQTLFYKNINSKKIYYCNTYVDVNYKNDTSNYKTNEYLNFKLFIRQKYLKFFKYFYILHKNNKSLVLDKNRSNVDRFLNGITSRGHKLKFLKYLNYIANIFFYSFIYKSLSLSQKFENYMIFYNFSKSNEFFFDFNFILNNIINLNESIFNLKVVKLNKKIKKKLKKNFDFELKYLKKHKRSITVLKSVHLYSNTFNYYRYYERLLSSVLITFFHQKNSRIYKKKIYTYNSILKKKSLFK